ncbi:MAG TPA: O-antigen ligase family protein [Anaerolineae bacterium]|nr:O-antigen ligase family protein [Anaerolineae bacterium]
MKRTAIATWMQSWLTSTDQTKRIAATVLVCVAVGLAGGALFGFLGPLLAVAVVVGLAGVLIMLRSTLAILAAMIGVICLLPFAALPLPGVGFSPTVLDVVLAMLLVTWMFQVARKKQTDLRSSTVGPAVLALMVLACVSFVIGLSFGSITTSLARQFAELLLSLGLFFLILNNVRGRERIEQVVTLLILGGCAAATVGVALYLLPENVTIRLLSLLRVFGYPTGSDVMVHVESNPELPFRATSTSINPNVLGGMLTLVAAVALPQLLSRDPLPLFARGPRRWGLNWLAVPVVGALVLCLLMTFSRGAMVGLAAAAAVMALLRYRKLLLLGVVGLGLLLLIPQMQWYLAHFLEGVQGEDLATQMRFGEYKDALILISRYPWFGVGFSGAPQIDVYVGVSNMYLLIAEEMGLAGLGTFLAAMGLALREMFGGLRRVADDARLESVLLGLVGATVAVLVTGIFDHYFLNINFQHAVALLWVLVGLGVAAAGQAKVAGTDSGQPPRVE